MKPCLDHGMKGNRQGYGRTYWKGHGKKVLSHRLAFFEANGYWPEVVMHSCDNPRCIEPEHLKAGTWAENNRDRAAKGRSAQVRYDKRTLSDEVVREIRERFASRFRGKDPINGVKALSLEFGVDTNVIYQVGRNKTYRDVV